MNYKYKLLINLIQGYPHLYDKANINFKDQRMRENSWQRISEELEIAVKDCQRIWLNLRNKYGRERRALPSGSGAPFTARWEYLESMSFLNEYVKPRNIHTITPVVAKNLQPTIATLHQCDPPLQLPIFIDATTSCSAMLNSNLTDNPLDCAATQDDIFMSPHSNKECEVLNFKEELTYEEVEQPEEIAPTANSEVLNFKEELTCEEFEQTEEQALTINPETVQRAGKGKSKNKRNSSESDTSEGFLDAVKSITEHLKSISRKPKTSADCLGEYIACVLKEMTPEEQKIKRRKLIAVLEDD